MYQNQQQQGRSYQQPQFKTKGFAKDRLQHLIQAKKSLRLKNRANQSPAKVINQLPPRWIDKVDEVKDSIIQMNEICMSSNGIIEGGEKQSRIHSNRTNCHPENIRPSGTCNFSIRVRHTVFLIMKECEETLAKLGQSSWHEHDEDVKMRMNAKMGLTLALQEVAFKLKAFQMEVIQDYTQKSIATRQTISTNTPRSHQIEQQIVIENFEVEYLEQMAGDRNERIRGLGEKMQKLTEVFRELNRLVIEQGTLLDRIDFNLETMFVNTKKGRQELEKANEPATGSSRASNCIFILVALNVGVIVALVLKFTLF